MFFYIFFRQNIINSTINDFARKEKDQKNSAIRPMCPYFPAQRYFISESSRFEEYSVKQGSGGKSFGAEASSRGSEKTEENKKKNTHTHNSSESRFSGLCSDGLVSPA